MHKSSIAFSGSAEEILLNKLKKNTVMSYLFGFNVILQLSYNKRRLMLNVIIILLLQENRLYYGEKILMLHIA